MNISIYTVKRESESPSMQSAVVEPMYQKRKSRAERERERENIMLIASQIKSYYSVSSWQQGAAGGAINSLQGEGSQYRMSAPSSRQELGCAWVPDPALYNQLRP